MLTYEDALQRILEAAPAPRSALVPLADALGCVLSKGVTSPLDLPPFDQAAVDGYAVRRPDGDGHPPHNGGPVALPVVGCASAGSPYRRSVQAGEAVRILTGAVVPRGADCVLMQEQVQRHGGRIIFANWPEAGRNIRRRGEDLRRGDQALDAGTRLRPHEIALLAALGHATVRVYRPPAVAILTTGDELQPAGRRLKPGRIYDSNGILLEALVRQAGARVIRLGVARDEMRSLVEKISWGLRHDVLLVAGGVSVGDKDFVRAAARRCGVREVFWQVNIKPGMPLWFGRRGRTCLFGLPGNPVSVFVTFEEFVKPALYRLMGRAWEDPYAVPAALASDLHLSPTRRTHFVRVRCDARRQRVAEPLTGQASHRLRSLVEADGWIRVTAEAGPWPAGTPVLVKEESR